MTGINFIYWKIIGPKFKPGMSHIRLKVEDIGSIFEITTTAKNQFIIHETHSINKEIN